MSNPATFVLVGHCGADTYSLSHAIRSAVPDAKIIAVDDDASCQAALSDQSVLLVNRVLDGRFSTGSGIDLIRSLAAARPEAKLILISNYADAQQAAVAAGAKPGFGKSQIGSNAIRDLLRELIEV